MKRFLSVLGILGVLGLGFFVFQLISGFRSVETKELRIGAAVFRVEIADTAVSQALGLSGRDNLDEGRGMLFVFSQPKIQKFWMKDMKFPIDIIWISDHKIVGMIIGAEPEAGTDYTIYESPEPADLVLELAAGAVQQSGIRMGDVVVISK